MSDYRYDYLLESHFKKEALLGAAMNAGRAAMAAAPGALTAVKNVGSAVGNAAGSVGRGIKSVGSVGGNFLSGAFFGGPTAKATTTGRLANYAGKATALAPIASTALPSVHAGGAGGPSANLPFAQLGGKTAAASLREMAYVHNMQKHAEHGALDKALHIAPYAAWAIGAGLEDTSIAKNYPVLPKLFSGGAYAGYALNSIRNAYTDPKERITGAIDAFSLMAMLGADVARWRRPEPVSH
jgi:hypothetical protein